MRTFICQNCHKEITLSYRIPIKAQPKYCSKECRGKMMARLRLQKPRKCRDCGKIKLYLDFEKTNLGNTYRLICKECRSKYMRNKNIEFKKSHGMSYSSYNRSLSAENFMRDSVHNAKRRAKSKNIKFNITHKYIVNLYHKQKGICVLSGKTMTWIVLQKKCPTNISIDRIDSKKGYIKGNIQLVCYFANIMKNNLKTENFLNWCECVYKTLKLKKGKIL